MLDVRYWRKLNRTFCKILINSLQFSHEASTIHLLALRSGAKVEKPCKRETSTYRLFREPDGTECSYEFEIVQCGKGTFLS